MSVPCGWCLDGNHHERTEATAGLPLTRGCAAEQKFTSGPMRGENKGLKCSCAAANHTLGQFPLGILSR